ncbi:MAG: DNA-methyltransferase [Promethearchaeota archaeon]
MVEDQVVYFKSSETMNEVPSESVTLVVTSPPYWNARDYDTVEQIGFNQSYNEYIRSLNKVWKECLRVLQPNGKIAINLQPLPISSKISKFGRRFIQNIMHDVERFMRENNMFLSGMHYWDKAPFINNVSWGSYPKPTNIASNTSFEQVFVWVKEGPTRKINPAVMERNVLKKQEWRHWAVRCIWDDIVPVIKINAKGENTFGHSAPFPEDIPFRIIKMHTVEGEIVLDPFLGSGTTLKVSRILGRRGIGYEINNGFSKKIKERIMEGWDPPHIDEGYINLGYGALNAIIKTAVDSVAPEDTGPEDRSSILKRVYKELEKQKLLSPALRKKFQKKLIT